MPNNKSGLQQTHKATASQLQFAIANEMLNWLVAALHVLLSEPILYIFYTVFVEGKCHGVVLGLIRIQIQQTHKAVVNEKQLKKLVSSLQTTKLIKKKLQGRLAQIVHSSRLLQL